MIAIQSLSQTIFLFLAFGIPALAFGLGFYKKPRLLAAVLVGQFAIMFACLGTLHHLVETGTFPQATGMEGIAFVVIPAMYVASLLASAVAYYVAASVSRKRQRG